MSSQGQKSQALLSLWGHLVLTAANQRDQMQYIVIWDKVAFYHFALVQNWFNTPTITVQYLPPYTPFLNPIKEFFSAWRWKVYDLRPYVQMALIQAMEEACDQIEAASIQGWICHSKIFFSRCLANGNIACDVDKALWLNPARRRDVFCFIRYWTGYVLCYSITVSLLYNGMFSNTAWKL